MSIPIKAQVSFVGTSFENSKWRTAMILCDGSLYLGDNFGKMYAVDRTFFGQTVKSFMNETLTTYNEIRRRRNLLIKEKNFSEADVEDNVSKIYKKQAEELKKVWKAFKSFSTKNKKKTNSNVLVNRMTMVQGLDLEYRRPVKNKAIKKNDVENNCIKLIKMDNINNNKNNKRKKRNKK